MKKLLIIGIDGGATKVSAWETVFDDKDKCFSLGELNAEKKYEEIPGYIYNFKPVDVKIQLNERELNLIPVTPNELQQETVYVEACASVIEKIVEKKGVNQILIGLGMPGLKTDNKRGIAVVANGPRMINYSDLLEERLQSVEIELISPVDHLGSDADYCGIGENYSARGAFKDYENAYYLGGGTGVADALKLNGQLLALDNAKDWLAKTWEMKSADGRSLENYCSASGIQTIFADLSAQEVTELNKNNIFPPQIAKLAIAGDKSAIETFNILIQNLAALLYSRITTLYCGWQNEFRFVNPNRPNLKAEHPYKGKLFNKLVLGQRLGDLYKSEEFSTIFKTPLVNTLISLIENSEYLDHNAKEYYRGIKNVLTYSELREAPALGAGIDAFFSWQD